MRKSAAPSKWINACILAGAGMFIVALIVAGAGHFLLMAGCLGGFLLTHRGGRGWLRFAAGGMIAIAYFIAIIIATGPQYIRLLKRIVGVS